jgi:hypothetical protein
MGRNRECAPRYYAKAEKYGSCAYYEWIIRVRAILDLFYRVLMSPDPSSYLHQTKKTGQLFVVVVSTANAIHRGTSMGIVSRFPCRGVCLTAGINFRQQARALRARIKCLAR